ncbi:hypothetical protein SNEBB_007993 [Seison nebaliae]|nr:hypothetical protein SNEBB_007993 [Seison nebaliae]
MGGNERYFRNSLQLHQIDDKRTIFMKMKVVISDIIHNDFNENGGLYTGGLGQCWTLLKMLNFIKNLDKHLFEKCERKIDRFIRDFTKKFNDDLNSKKRRIFINGDASFPILVIFNQFIRFPFVNMNLVKSCVEEYVHIGRMINEDENYLENDEMLTGKAGYLMGLKYLSELLIKMNYSNILSTIDEVIEGVVRQIMRNGMKNSTSNLQWYWHDKEYYGGAHGVCGIVGTLLMNHRHLNNEQLNLIYRKIRRILTFQNHDGNIPSSKSSRNRQAELVHWCHGAPGYVPLLILMNNVRKERNLSLEEFDEMKILNDFGELIWKKGLLKKGPGLCHGISGNGYMFLYLFKLTSNVIWLERGKMFSQFLFSETFKEARIPDRPFSLFEGWCGALCFLYDLYGNPEEFQFPFYHFF